MTKTAIFPEDHLLRICDALASSGSGLTGTEIGTFLLRLDMADPGAGVTKKTRLFEALGQRQNRDGNGSVVVAFIQAAMEPARYVGTAHLFETRRTLLNNILVQSDLLVGEDGKVHTRSLTEQKEDSAERASTFARILESRPLHAEVLRPLQDGRKDFSSYKLAVQLVRGVSDRIREISGLTCDGAELVDRAFGGLNSGRMPLVALADLASDSGRSEQTSLIGLTKGFLSTFRSSVGFAPRIPWNLSDEDLLDLAAFASFLHRKLDQAVRLRRSHELYGKDDPPIRLTPH
jgi:uncharacterized protein (TIGR02391 family)